MHRSPRVRDDARTSESIRPPPMDSTREADHRRPRDCPRGLCPSIMRGSVSFAQTGVGFVVGVRNLGEEATR